jgi:hypothetical protein
MIYPFRAPHKNVTFAKDQSSCSLLEVGTRTDAPPAWHVVVMLLEGGR